MTEPTMEDFQRHLEKHPDFLNKIQRETDLENFLNTYQVNRKTRLCCPVCTEGWDRGTLYQSTEIPTSFTCKKCKRTFTLGLPPDNQSCLDSLDEAHKQNQEQKKAKKEAEKERVDKLVQDWKAKDIIPGQDILQELEDD